MQRAIILFHPEFSMVHMYMVHMVHTNVRVVLV